MTIQRGVGTTPTADQANQVGGALHDDDDDIENLLRTELRLAQLRAKHRIRRQLEIVYPSNAPLLEFPSSSSSLSFAFSPLRYLSCSLLARFYTRFYSFFALSRSRRSLLAAARPSLSLLSPEEEEEEEFEELLEEEERRS